jgi:hypothetical protein
MKTSVVLISLVAFLLICSCNTVVSNDETMQFIPGTYVRQNDGEFGKSYDTLSFTLQNESAKQYKIERRFLYARVIDGKPLEPEYRQQKNSGIYNPQTKTITESRSGKIYSFDIKKGVLYSGPNEFKKLKH